MSRKDLLVETEVSSKSRIPTFLSAKKNWKEDPKLYSFGLKKAPILPQISSSEICIICILSQNLKRPYHAVTWKILITWLINENKRIEYIRMAELNYDLHPNI